MAQAIKKFGLILALTVTSLLPLGMMTSATSAQELSPEHLDLARQYVDLTDSSQIYERTLIQTGIATMRTIVSQNPEITEQVSESIGQVIASYADEKDNLLDQFARVYALRFTQGELEEIVAFYSTEVGQKLAEQNSQAGTELEAVMRVFQNNLNTEFYARVRAELREADINI